MFSYPLKTDPVMVEGKVGDFLIFRPSAKNLFPTCRFSLATHWVPDPVGQLYGGAFASAGNARFLQAKWNF